MSDELLSDETLASMLRSKANELHDLIARAERAGLEVHVDQMREFLERMGNEAGLYKTANIRLTVMRPL